MCWTDQLRGLEHVCHQHFIQHPELQRTFCRYRIWAVARPVCCWMPHFLVVWTVEWLLLYVCRACAAGLMLYKSRSSAHSQMHGDSISLFHDSHHCCPCLAVLRWRWATSAVQTYRLTVHMQSKCDLCSRHQSTSRALLRNIHDSHQHCDI